MKLSVSDETAEKMTSLQHKLFETDVSTIIIFEGPGGIIMSHMVNEIISIFEPRNIDYTHVNPEEDWLVQVMENIPPRGKIGIFDRAWYSGAIVHSDDFGIKDAIAAINKFERYLVNNGVNLVKVFLDFDKDEIEEHEDSYPVGLDEKCGFLDDGESDYDDFCASRKIVSKLLKATDQPHASWDVVKVKDYRKTVRAIADCIVSRLEFRVNNPVVSETFTISEIYPNPREDGGSSGFIDGKEYDEKLEKYQKRLAELQLKLARSDRFVMIGFEGWDAAGKGGVIKRITRALNPRGYRTVPVPAPTAEEKAHTHLWRFVTKIPEPGHITIFDRTWYGRMMVEPIEGFCTEAEYSRAAEEINFFEKAITENGGIVLKFWIDVSKDEQLVRFNERKNNPMKQWKLTDEDWRNREKWDVYERYIDSMIKQTNTPYAPWYVIRNDCKKYGRIKTLKTICDVLEKELDD